MRRDIATMLVLLLGFGLLSSCGGKTTCVAGRVEACPCPNGVMGAQTCMETGTFGPCRCESFDGGPPTDRPVDAGADLPLDQASDPVRFDTPPDLQRDVMIDVPADSADV